MLNQQNLVFLLLASAYKPEIVAAQATTNAKVLRDEWKRLEVIGSGAAAVRLTVSQFRLLLGAFEEYRSIIEGDCFRRIDYDFKDNRCRVSCKRIFAHCGFIGRSRGPH